jgi:hypothetical protein
MLEYRLDISQELSRNQSRTFRTLPKQQASSFGLGPHLCPNSTEMDDYKKFLAENILSEDKVVSLIIEAKETAG